MVTIRYKCCLCGNVWRARKVEGDLTSRYRQCPDHACRSYSTLPVENYDNILGHIVRGNPVDLPVVESFFFLLLSEGVFTHRFKEKATIMNRILREAEALREQRR